MLDQLHSKLGLTSKACKRAKMNCDFAIGLADTFPFEAGRATYGIEWAVKTGRLPGQVEMTIRKMNTWDFVNLIAEVVDAGISQNDTPRWLIKKLGA